MILISGEQTMLFQRTPGDEPDDGYSLPIGTFPPQQQQQHEEEQAEAGGVPISDLSSWGSSEDGESLGPQKPALGLFAGGVKKSAGIMDLSKFLTPSDEDEKDEDFREQAEVEKFVEEPNQRIYDSVENLVSAGDEVKSLNFRLVFRLDW